MAQALNTMFNLELALSSFKLLKQGSWSETSQELAKGSTFSLQLLGLLMKGDLTL